MLFFCVLNYYKICKNEVKAECIYFFYCTFAITIWFASPFSLRHNYWVVLNIAERFQLMLRLVQRHNLNSGECRLWSAIILDQIWRTRNALVHDGSAPNPVECMERCSSRRCKFQWPRQESSVLEARKDTSFWTPPPREFIKINVDALVSDNTTSTGWFGIGNSGVFGPKGCHIEEAKAVAIEKGILFALNEGWKKVIIKFDCFVVVKK